MSKFVCIMRRVTARSTASGEFRIPASHWLQLLLIVAIFSSIAMPTASIRNICFSDIDGTLVHYLDDPAQLQEVR
jgi:hypothetical protein